MPTTSAGVKGRSIKISALVLLVLVAGILLCFLAAFVAWAAYSTLIEGTTGGPDVIAGIREGQILPESVTSIEVFAPSPYVLKPSSLSSTQWDYYDGLQPIARITSPVTLRRLLLLLSNAKVGRKHQNHPGTVLRLFLKINVPAGCYWTECRRLVDRQSDVLLLNANTLNATNPNGASTYYLEDFSEVLSVIEPTSAEVGDQLQTSVQ